MAEFKELKIELVDGFMKPSNMKKEKKKSGSVLLSSALRCLYNLSVLVFFYLQNRNILSILQSINLAILFVNNYAPFSDQSIFPVFFQRHILQVFKLFRLLYKRKIYPYLKS